MTSSAEAYATVVALLSDLPAEASSRVCEGILAYGHAVRAETIQAALEAPPTPRSGIRQVFDHTVLTRAAQAQLRLARVDPPVDPPPVPPQRR